MFLLSACKVQLLLQRDFGICSLPKWTRNHLVLHQHPEINWKCYAGGDPSDSPRKSWWLSPRIGWFRIKVDVFSAWSPPNGFTVPSATGKMNTSPLLGKITSFALSLLLWISDASIVSSSSTSSTIMSPFQIPSAYRAYSRKIPGNPFFPNWWIRDWSCGDIGWYSTKETKGIIGPLNGSPKRLSYGVFPSDKRSWIFRS